jgi:hypothetical protein
MKNYPLSLDSESHLPNVPFSSMIHEVFTVSEIRVVGLGRTNPKVYNDK